MPPKKKITGATAQAADALATPVRRITCHAGDNPPAGGNEGPSPTMTVAIVGAGEAPASGALQQQHGESPIASLGTVAGTIAMNTSLAEQQSRVVALQAQLEELQVALLVAPEPAHGTTVATLTTSIVRA